ncbi:hypothetical protein D6C77_10598 [Aureobasidium pullulans]|nr:hypothetical protein D6C77_10598 [Aureobasidium pullulans]
MKQRLQLLFLWLALIAPALCACKNIPSDYSDFTNPPSLAATSFCKCTCFSNSTIIPLTNIPGESTAKKATCNDCNRQFCLSYNLPICKDAKDADVFTTCFQRDSTKDQLIVFTFIFVTCGLLIWATVRPYAETYLEKFRNRHSYNPVAQNGN